MQQATLIGTPDSIISRTLEITESPPIKYEPQPIAEFLESNSPPELNLNDSAQVGELRTIFSEMKSDLLRYITLYIDNPKALNIVKKILENYSILHTQKVMEILK